MVSLSRAEFERIFLRAVNRLRKKYAPRRKGVLLKHPNNVVTGNLKFNAIKYRWKNATTFEIYVDEDVAPYMPYTNEKWISPRWNGTPNPNEKWWENACKEIIEYIQHEIMKMRWLKVKKGK